MNVVGVDVASREHVVFVGGKSWTVKNTAVQLKKFLASLSEETVIALESTGRYGDELLKLAGQIGRTVYVLNPRRIKRFRESLDYRAKTDRIDAELIAEYVRLHHERLHPFEPCPEPYASLRELSRKRALLAQDRQKLAARMKGLQEFKSQSKALLRSFDAMLKSMDARIAKMLKSVPNAEPVLSVVGIGPLGAAACLGALGHHSFRNAAAFVAYAGLDLRTSDSGKRKGRKRLSKRGDRVIRKLLYLSAMSASLTRTWRPYYLRKLEQGYKRVQALVALARMLAKAVFGVFKTGLPFREPLCSLRA